MSTQERHLGLHSLLRFAGVYRLFQASVSRESERAWLMKEHFRPKEGCRIVDVGCGPGTRANELPNDCELYGFDPNEGYIADASRRYAGTFVVGDMRRFLDLYGDQLAGSVDLVICCGVLHHVSTDEVAEIMAGSKMLLKEGGRFAAIEPTRLQKQDYLSRFLVSQDRGQNVLMDYEWSEHLRRHFPKYETKVVNRLLRIPYTHVLMTGWKDSDS
jgi:SAM-dependent methyltransferase